MNIDPADEGSIIIHSSGVGVVTRKMVRERAVELAVIDGRSAHEASKADWDMAKRELTGAPSLDPNQALLDMAPESERWDPVPGSTGTEAPMTSEDGEDEEGRSLGEVLTDQGLKEADHDQMLKAARDAENEDRDA
jgi:hypothetical protein